jgi:hypothetical protein
MIRFKTLGVAMAVTLLGAGAASAADMSGHMMKKPMTMKRCEAMGHDAMMKNHSCMAMMKKHDAMMKHDAMKHDSMMKGDAMKGDAMKKPDAMKHDSMMKSDPMKH